MTEATQPPAFALVIRIEPGPANAVDSQGWKVVNVSHEIGDLVPILRRKARYLTAIGGEGMVIRRDVEGEGDGPRIMMHSAVQARNAPALKRLPRILETSKRETWERQVEAYVVAAEAAEAAQVGILAATSDGRKVVVRLPSRRVSTGFAAAAALAGALYYIPWGAIGFSDILSGGRTRTEVARGSGASGSHDAQELAEGGTIRRLQAVSQAFGKQY